MTQEAVGEKEISMKRTIIDGLFIVVFALILVSCANTDPEDMINPGDMIGDFLITTGKGDEVTYNWELNSALVQQGNEEIYTAQIPVDTKMNVSWGIYADFSGNDLDKLWSEHTYKMYINDCPVNLDAFGWMDIKQPVVGQMRHWNVVIVATKPGEISVRTEATVNGQDYGDIKTYTFGTH